MIRFHLLATATLIATLATACGTSSPPTSVCGVCDDGVACTVDSCNTETERCQVTVDDSACNAGEICDLHAGCIDGGCCVNDVDCDDRDLCTDDACTDGLCTSSNNSATCDDGDACTATDVCADGACAGSGVVTCDDSSACTDDSCESERGCLNTDNGSCECLNDAHCVDYEDADVCNGTLVCDAAGACVIDETTVVTCDTSSDNQCFATTCNPETGVCSGGELPSTALCDDGDLCTTADVCNAGACAGTAVTCDGGGDTTCAANSCNGATGSCEMAPINEGGGCDDGSLCITGEVCSAGACVGAAVVCDASGDSECMANLCDATSGTCAMADINEAGTRSDDDMCTTADSCTSGVCVGTTVVCDTGGNTTCGVNQCNAASGQCEITAVADSTPCDDGSICTSADQCVGIVCQGTPKVCDDADACTTDSCDPTTGSCGFDIVSCDDGNLCTDDSCDTVTGCASTPNTAPCDDGNPCTEGDSCVGASCMMGAFKDCDDADFCTTDSCDLTTGACLYAVVTCDDGDICTDDSCAFDGCSNTTNAASCDDGDACTSGEYQCNSDITTCGDAAETCCGDLADNDGDGFTDCADGDCTGTFSCTDQTIDWCNLQFPDAALDSHQGQLITVYGQVLITGLTNLTQNGPDIHPLVVGQVGVGANGSAPDGGTWSWTDAAANSGFTTISNNDEYMADLVVPSVVGSPYDYAFRFSGDGGTTWSYCDRDGTDNGYDPAMAGALTVVPPNLFFYEYVEGSSYNKAYEIYNASGYDVPTESCSVRVYINGGTTPNSETPLEAATLVAGGVFTVCESRLDFTDDPNGDGSCDQFSGNMSNGDDVLELVCGGLVMDIIGQIGFDPGTEWGTGLTSTADNTLRRNCTVTQGDRDGSDVFDPATEWGGFATDTLLDLGTASCFTP